MRRSPAGLVAVYSAAVAVGLFALGPFAWMVLTSIKADDEILRRTPVLWPAHPTLHRYGAVLESGFARALRNSLVVAGATTVVGVALAALAVSSPSGRRTRRRSSPCSTPTAAWPTRPWASCS
jgi:ABC-type glycerol-3-phosphate transport system permease component